MFGAAVSHYTDLEKLGARGMNVGSKADSAGLKRTLAVVFLPLNHLSTNSLPDDRITK